MSDESSYRSPTVVVAIAGVVVAVLAIIVPLLISSGSNPPTAPPSSPIAAPPSAGTPPAGPATPAPSPVPLAPAPAVTPSPAVRGPGLPYTADWTSDMDGWVGSDAWNRVGGKLANSGQDYGGLVLLSGLRPGHDRALEALGVADCLRRQGACSRTASARSSTPGHT